MALYGVWSTVTMQPKVRFTSDAAILLRRIRADYPVLVMLLDDSSCCSNSNVMLRRNLPSWPVSLVAEVEGIRIVVNPMFQENVHAEQLLIDAVDSADDSLSLETNYGKRLIMLEA